MTLQVNSLNLEAPEQASILFSLPDEVQLIVTAYILGDNLAAIRNALGFIGTSRRTYALANDRSFIEVFKKAKSQLSRWVEDPKEVGVSNFVDYEGRILKVKKLRMHV
jgi:hypothetical protein